MNCLCDAGGVAAGMSTTLQLQLRSTPPHLRSSGSPDGDAVAVADSSMETNAPSTAAAALEHELQIVTESETIVIPVTGIVLTGSEFDTRCGDGKRTSPELGTGVKLIDLNPRYGAFAGYS